MTPLEQEQPADRVKPRSQRFRRASNAVALTSDQRRRQARIMAAAWRILGSRDAVIGFFNSWSNDLAGRPLDLATDSEDGFAAVEQVLLGAEISPVAMDLLIRSTKAVAASGLVASVPAVGNGGHDRDGGGAGSEEAPYMTDRIAQAASKLRSSDGG